MKITFRWVTATLSTCVIGITAATTAMFVVANPSQVVSNLAPAVMSGVGCTLGAALGGLLVLRFKAVRSFIHNIVREYTKQ